MESNSTWVVTYAPVLEHNFLLFLMGVIIFGVGMVFSVTGCSDGSIHISRETALIWLFGLFLIILSFWWV
jgi:hypothetical protein